MTFVEVLLNVLSIIGIVAIGGAVIYFLGGLLLSILESKNKKETVETQSFTQEETKVVSNEQQFVAEEKYEDTLVDEKFSLEDEKVEAVDFDKATEEKKSLEPAQEQKDDLNNLFNDEKEFNFDDFDFDAFFNEQNETAAQETAPVEEPAAIVEEVAEPIVEETAPVVEEQPAAQTITTVEEVKTEEVAVAQEAAAEPAIVEAPAQNNEVENELRAEIEALKAELAEQKALYEALKLQAEDNQKKWEEEKLGLEALYQEAEKREQEAAGKTQSALSIEEYEARLVLLRERLKANEYELKQNRKEFLPLKRVRKNLDKDKAKLRRREALVAKQKVLLYGVNNIAEIDQEKAKKLAEDLDLLDGLKVSVRHCEEVMEANKDRYPILETANRILVTTNEELKADIQACELAIRKLNGEDVDADIAALEQPVSEQPKRKRGRPRKEKVEETQQININELVAQDTTIVHTAQTESNIIDESKEVLNNIIVEEPVQEIKVFAAEAPETAEKQTTIEIKKETITHTITETTAPKAEVTSLDDYEPSLEELFAVENENLFNDFNDFNDFDDKK
ncbi:MAG: hypothetical protein IKK20_02395 [Clostridia bacterium]|nr:hypothetical protein [Clostridia bacterium]MBR2221065.1 hypothetical protein [Clostridia bacterium]MBR2433035.1 hypothetical protein [Clostridia bacterium]MBR3790633.1 hypothetical protein [Clostridia bacterium]